MTTRTERGTGLDCPSAQSDMKGARIIGLISGSASEPRIAYLKKSAVPGMEINDKLGDIEPTQVFRFAAQCEESRCKHFGEGRCSLGARIAKQLPEVVDVAPPCQIRNTCRWHAEQGIQVCFRCPQVVTLIPPGDYVLNQVA